MTTLVYLWGGQVLCRGPKSRFDKHPPCKAGGQSWKLVDEETGEVVDRYSPRPLRRVQACPPRTTRE